MIREFAVEPSLLGSWERFRYLTEKFGVSNGRLISRYPKRWKALVYESLTGIGEVERKRIEEKLLDIDNKMVVRLHEWKDGLNWLENSERESSARRFHAIIAAENPRGNDRVMTYDELDEMHPLWKPEIERIIPRTADELAAAVAPLLRISKSVVFVDPYLSPGKPRLKRTIRALLKACLDQRLFEFRLEKVEFYTRHKPENSSFEQDCQRVFGPEVPLGVSVHVILLDEKEGGEGLHNRFILTERGGVKLGWGLDEGRTGQTDEMSILQEKVFQERWNNYCGEQPAFIRKGAFAIRGEREGADGN